MAKKLLPCPVCGGESFIESVTQGGLICTDCGAVSNQVEVADDDDPLGPTKTFIRSMSYKKVTDAESKAKRDRRVVLKHKDMRDVSTILKGFGLILDHMVSCLVSRGLCLKIVGLSVRSVWFDFLHNVVDPVVVSKKYSKKLGTHFANWGMPSFQTQSEIVLRDVFPALRSNQHRALCKMLSDRNLAHSGIKVVEEGPLVVYAHDWLCLFFKCTQFPIPSDLLSDFLAIKITVDRVVAYHSKIAEGASTAPEATTSLTAIERTNHVRKLFRKITSNVEIRKKFGPRSLKKPKISSPRIDLSLMLAVLIIGIRNSGGGVLATHVLNWIARTDLPYLSAHKILPPNIDRIEYYRISRSNHGYDHSVFCPSSQAIPNIFDLNKKVNHLSKFVHVDKPNTNPETLAKTCLNMLGLDPLLPICVYIIKAVINNDAPIFYPDKPNLEKRLSQYTPFNPLANTLEKIQECFIADLTLCEFVATVIAFAAKLVFPQLHTEHTLQHRKITHELLSIASSVTVLPYSVQSDRDLNGPVESRVRDISSIEWWDNFNNTEKTNLIKYIENDLFNENRESVVEDIREIIRSDLKIPPDNHKPVQIFSGVVTNYTTTLPVHHDSLIYHLLRDVCAVAELKHNTWEKISRKLANLEDFFT